MRPRYVGSYYFDPRFGGGRPGLSHADSHDVALIVCGDPGCHTPKDTVSSYTCGSIPSSTPMVGGGKPALPRGVRLDLELLDHRRFGNGVVYMRHGVRSAA